MDDQVSGCVQSPSGSNPLLTDWVDMKDVSRVYPPLPLINYEPPKYSGPVLAIGRAVYEAQPQRSTDNLLKFADSISRQFPPGNLWWLPTYERMTYPYAVYWPLACAFKTEMMHQRRFDWYLWIDDDVLISAADLFALIEGANKNKTRFIAALPYDRMPPHSPSVMEKIEGQPRKWIKAPKSGCYPVYMTGFVMCLFHRSIFEIVPEPWFGVCAPSYGFAGIAPDWWWCFQMEKVGLQPWVCCDTNVTHLGHKQECNREMSEKYMEQVDPAKLAFLADRKHYVSSRTGAIVIEPPMYPDGRVDRTIKDGDKVLTGQETVRG